MDCREVGNQRLAAASFEIEIALWRSLDRAETSLSRESGNSRIDRGKIQDGKLTVRTDYTPDSLRKWMSSGKAVQLGFVVARVVDCQASAASTSVRAVSPETGIRLSVDEDGSFGHAAAAPPSNEMNSRRFIRSPRRCERAA